MTQQKRRKLLTLAIMLLTGAGGYVAYESMVGPRMAVVSVDAGGQATQEDQPTQVAPEDQKVAQGNKTVVIFGAPTVTQRVFVAQLTLFKSPLSAEDAYRLCVQYGINPAFVAGLGLQEDHFETGGRSLKNNNWGNVKGGKDKYPQEVGQDNAGFAIFASPLDGFKAWCQHVTGPLYLGAGLKTLKPFIDRYCPDGEQKQYIKTVTFLYTVLSQGKIINKQGKPIDPS